MAVLNWHSVPADLPLDVWVRIHAIGETVIVPTLSFRSLRSLRDAWVPSAV